MLLLLLLPLLAFWLPLAAVQLAGPEGSPYEGGWFDVRLQFTPDFPGKQPRAYFKTEIWHPNVDQPPLGYVCMWLGGGFRQDVCSVACVLVGLQTLLANPNPDSPVNYYCAQQMRKQPQEYEAKARSWTQKYAM